MTVLRGRGNGVSKDMTLERKLGVAAVVILVFSLSALVYGLLNLREAGDTVRINGVDYEWAGLEENFTVVDLDGHRGVRLSDIINDTGLEDPEDHQYAIVGADGYRKTVDWNDMLNGVLKIDGKEVYFTTRVKQYFVRDIVEIEVV